jgi:hypothetical protein
MKHIIPINSFHLNPRKRLLCFLVFGFFSFANYAQNLVPNGSFEEYEMCPDGLSQLPFATGWLNVVGTCDFFHECSENVGVPTNSEAEQYPFAENGYAGLFCFDQNNFNNREIMCTQLTAELEIGTTYYYSFRCVRGERSSNKRSCNNIGLRFETELPTTEEDWITNYAHLTVDTIVNDTINWNFFSGSITPTNNFKYLAIGNFYTDDQTQSFSFDEVYDRYAYYLFDDIRLSTDSSFVLNTGYPLLQNQIFSMGTNFIGAELSVELLRTGQLLVYDIYGNLVHMSNLSEGAHRINLSALSQGFYAINFVCVSGEYFVSKIYKN